MGKSPSGLGEAIQPRETGCVAIVALQASSQCSCAKAPSASSPAAPCTGGLAYVSQQPVGMPRLANGAHCSRKVDGGHLTKGRYPSQAARLNRNCAPSDVSAESPATGRPAP